MKKLLFLCTLLAHSLTAKIVITTHEAIISPCITTQIYKAPNTNNQQKISLSDAVKTAFDKRPSIKAAAALTESKTYQTRQTLSPYAPNITASTGIVGTTSAPSVPTTLSVSGNQLIFKADIADQYNIADKQTEIARLNEELNKFQIRFDIEIGFINIWLLQRQYKLMLSLLKSTKAQYEQSKAQEQYQLLDKSVWLKAEADYQTNLSAVDQYRDTLHAACTQFEQKLGTEIHDKAYSTNSDAIAAWPTFEWQWDAPVVIKELEHYYQKALTHRKELESQDKTIESYKLQSKAAMKQYLPAVSLNGGWSRTTQYGGSYDTTAANLNVGWNIFDGLYNYLNSKTASSLEMKAILDKDEIHNSIRSDVHVTYADLMKLHKQLVSQKSTLKAAKNEYTLSRQKFSLGLEALVNFQTARTTWFNAEFTWLKLKTAAVTKYCELLFKCGYPE